MCWAELFLAGRGGARVKICGILVGITRKFLRNVGKIGRVWKRINSQYYSIKSGRKSNELINRFAKLIKMQ